MFLLNPKSCSEPALRSAVQHLPSWHLLPHSEIIDPCFSPGANPTDAGQQKDGWMRLQRWGSLQVTRTPLTILTRKESFWLFGQQRCITPALHKDPLHYLDNPTPSLLLSQGIFWLSWKSWSFTKTLYNDPSSYPYNYGISILLCTRILLTILPILIHHYYSLPQLLWQACLSWTVISAQILVISKRIILIILTILIYHRYHLHSSSDFPDTPDLSLLLSRQKPSQVSLQSICSIFKDPYDNPKKSRSITTTLKDASDHP